MSTQKTIAWFVWIIASIFYAYQYILRVMPNIMLNDIMQQFDIDAAIFGQFSGVYYIGYSLMHLPIGIMLDRFGPRKVMTCCILLTVAGLLPIIYADNWLYPIIGRALIGIGSSAAILGTFKIIRMTFSEDRFTRMLSFSVTIGLIGAIYGGGPVSYMCSTLGYKTVIEIFAVIGLLLATLTYYVVPEIRENKNNTVISDIKLVLTNHKVIASCFFAGLLVGPLEGFADVWGSEFLKQAYAIDAKTASYLPSMIFVGMCFGAPFLSMIAEKTKNYTGTIIAAGTMMFVVFSALVTKTITVNMLSICFILVGICCAYQIVAIYRISTYVPEKVAGLTTALANMIIMSFGYAFHSLIGFIINANGGTSVADSFIYGVSIIPATLIIGIAGFMFIAYKDKQESKTLKYNTNSAVL